MKKLLAMIAIAALVFTATPVAYAASSGTVDIKVTIDHTISIEIKGGNTGDGNVDFGNLGLNTTKVCPKSITVKNDGSGVKEKVALNVTVPTGYTLSFQFTNADTQPTAGDANWKAYNEIAEEIAHNVTKYLWVKITTPQTTGDIEKVMSLAINAAVAQ